MKKINLVNLIDEELPQTQCKRCGYASCRPYAEAIALGNEDINRCPPGGTKVMKRLSKLTGKKQKNIDPSCGEELDPKLLLIDETNCIGCGLCIPSCPVDAIVGAKKFMHTIIKEECTGCELCTVPCPVDCISIIKRPDYLEWNKDRAKESKVRFKKRQKRIKDVKELEISEEVVKDLKANLKNDLSL